jgi:Cys-rich repeat protein
MKRLGFLLPLGLVVIAFACEAGPAPDDDDDDDDGEGGSTTSTSSSSSTKSTTVASTTASTTASSTSVASSTAMSVSSSTGMVVPVPIGATCDSDSDCGTDGRCVLPSDDDPIFGGGPAGGYCTQDCTTNADCGAGNFCLDQGGTQECLLGCEIGPVLEFLDDPLDPAKCLGREDVACRSVNATDTVCVPTCGDDSQCPAGRSCDPLSAVCVDMPNSGLPTGSACDPLGTDCAGVCIDLGTFAQCSTNCVLGGDLDGSDCGGLTEGLCIFSIAGSGAGDAAFCSPACATHAQCQMPFMSCFNIGLTDGYCFAPDPCPNGQADCTFPGTECTTTPDGPLCLDSTYPLE